MPRLNSANNAWTKLDDNMDSSQTTLKVDNSSDFPDTPFRITIDNNTEITEIIEVTDVDDNEWTVIRGMENTTATNHDKGATIENNFTAGTYDELANKQQEEWIEANLENGWEKFSDSYETAMFMKDEFGFVYFDGLITGGSKKENMFTLPEGYRPDKHKSFIVVTDGEPGRVMIRSNGEVSLTDFGNDGYVYLNGIVFKV